MSTQTLLPHPPGADRTENEPAGVSDRPASDRPARRLVRQLRRTPFTLGVLLLLLTAGTVTQTLWRAADSDSLAMRALSFGAERLHDGQLWTFVTGAVLLPRPEFYLVVGLIVAVVVGAYERRVGSRRAAFALIGTQLIGTGVAALLLLPLQHGPWAWANTVSGDLDLGLSAGALGVIGAASALFDSPWRTRIRAVGLAYLAAMLLRSGLLWDLEHLLAFGAGIAAGPRLAGRSRLPWHLPRLDEMGIRLGVGVLVVISAVTTVVETIYPGVGGLFGNGLPATPPAHGLAVVIAGSAVAVLVADALRRGRAAAWWVAVAGSSLTVVNSLVNVRGPIRIGDTIGAAIILVALLAFRNAWHWRTPDGFAVRSLRRVVLAVLVFGAGWITLIWAVQGHFRSVPDVTDVLREAMSRFTFSTGPLVPRDALAHAVLAITAVAWAATLIGLLVGWLYADRGPDAGSKEKIGRLLRRHGGGSLGWMRTWPTFSTWTTRDGQVAISYCVVGTVAIAIGDPVGPTALLADAVRQFQTHCRYAGWTPAWFAATGPLVQAARGWRAVQIGEDTILDLPTLEFVGKSWQDVRTARNRAARENITMVTGRLTDFAPDLRQKIERLSQDWVSQKALPEMGFTLGTVGHALDPEMRTHVAIDAGGEVQGVTTWLPVHRDGAVVGWTLDLMRRHPDGFRPVMEYLIAESALEFKQQGYRTVSLSVAPLARRSETAGRRRLLDRTLDVISRLLEPAYGFRSLLAFKAKFHPQFLPVYLMYSRPADLPAISLAIGRAYLPHLDARSAAGLALSMRRSRHPATAAKTGS